MTSAFSNIKYSITITLKMSTFKAVNNFYPHEEESRQSKRQPQTWLNSLNSAKHMSMRWSLVIFCLMSVYNENIHFTTTMSQFVLPIYCAFFLARAKYPPNPVGSHSAKILSHPRSAPHQHQTKLLVHVSLKSPSNISLSHQKSYTQFWNPGTTFENPPFGIIFLSFFFWIT